MSQTLRARGPDDQGYAGFFRGRKPDCLTRDVQSLEGSWGALIHRRLSILDLSEKGWQPMKSGPWSMTYNGEVYNFVELRQELRALGETFQSDSDSEVVLKAFDRWKEDAFLKFNGMFAMAVFDEANDQLYLARDPFGIKPLYYSVSSEGFAFASRVQTLLHLPWVSRRIDPQGLYDYLRYNRADSQVNTLLKGVLQVMPGCFLKVDLNTFAVEQISYWRPTYKGEKYSSRAEAAEHLRSLFLTNIKLHMRSDVPVGCLLSGGIDSSSIAMGIRNLFPDQELHTFSYYSGQKELDERKWIQLVNEASHAMPHYTEIQAADLVPDLDEFIRTQDLPVGSTSMYAQYRVFKLVREQGVKVVLDGQGADELFGGYGHYLGARLASLIAQRKYLKAFEFYKSCQNFLGMGQKEIFMRALSYFVPGVLKDLGKNLTGHKLIPNWMNRDWIHDNQISVEPIWEQPQTKEILKDQLVTSLVDSSLPMLLRYEDRNSMHFSVESRVPFLTRELVEFAYSLPEEYIVSEHGQTKSILREAMRGLVPNAILDRKDKVGFATPEAQWLKDLAPWIDATINQADEIQFPLFDLSQMRMEWNEIKNGRKPLNHHVWRWVNFIHWAEKTEARV